jgi:hypothetical protein
LLVAFPFHSYQAIHLLEIHKVTSQLFDVLRLANRDCSSCCIANNSPREDLVGSH